MHSLSTPKIATLVASWPAPKNVHALTTTRLGGVSQPPFDNSNLALHVGDDDQLVSDNRAILQHQLHLPASPLWLKQTHSNAIITAPQEYNPNIEADAVYTREKSTVLAILTADCMPILICNQKGNEIAAIHAGWRGLASDIVEKTIQRFSTPADQLLVFLGPTISQHYYEVGPEVKDAFTAQSQQFANCFIPSPNKKWQADLNRIAMQQLQAIGIKRIYTGDRCTYHHKELFYSYRRDGKTGRMASLIWFT